MEPLEKDITIQIIIARPHRLIPDKYVYSVNTDMKTTHTMDLRKFYVFCNNYISSKNVILLNKLIFSYQNFMINVELDSIIHISPSTTNELQEYVDKNYKIKQQAQLNKGKKTTRKDAMLSIFKNITN